MFLDVAAVGSSTEPGGGLALQQALDARLGSGPGPGPGSGSGSGPAPGSVRARVRVTVSVHAWHSGEMAGNLGVEWMTFLYTSLIVSPQNGGSPQTISYSTQPNDHQSTSNPYVLRIQISGARYTGVPQKVSAVGDSFESPKSVSLTWPSLSSSTFSGLRSRYMTPSLCRCCSAKKIALA